MRTRSFPRLTKHLRHTLAIALVTTLCSALAAQPAQSGGSIATMKPTPQANRVTGKGGTVQLKGHIPVWVTPSRLVAKSVDLASPVHLYFVLQRDPNVQTAFTQFLAQQQQPGSPYYHQWLKPQQVGQFFGLTASDVAAVTSWLSLVGLKINSVSPGLNIVEASGTVASVSVALHTSFGYYSYRQQPILTATTEPFIPVALAPVIQSIAGLTQLPAQSDIHVTRGQRKSSSGSKPDITIGSSHYLLPADFDVIYDITSLKAAGNTGATIGSASQRVAVVGRSRVDPVDISRWITAAGLNANIQSHLNEIVVPGGTDPGITNTGDQDEATLDVERVMGTAPGAGVDLFLSNDGDLRRQASYNVNTLLDPVMTMSFGIGETGDNYDVSFWDSLFSTAASEGISAFVAAGDSGAAEDDPNFTTPPSSQVLAPNALCSSTYVTCVGGTEFNDTSNPSTYWSSSNGTSNVSALSYIPEGVWNETIGTDSNGNAVYQVAAGGGGVSAYITKPLWQTGTGVPADGYRDTPDVSFSAAAHDAYYSCEEYLNENCGSIYGSFSGTSAAAPGMAGISALLNTAMGSRQGNLNPLIYRLATTAPAVFHDSTIASSGVGGCTSAYPSMCNNSIPSPNSATGGQAGYVLTTGYDQATGWGSLDVGNFIAVAASSLIPTSLAIAGGPSPTSADFAPTFTATVTPLGLITTSGGGIVPVVTGVVQFYANGNPIDGPATVINNVATLLATGLAPGTYGITAIYSGDLSYSGSNAVGLNETVVNGYAFTAQVLHSSAPQVVALTGYELANTGIYYYEMTSSYFTGPGASYFTAANASTWAENGANVQVTFTPTVVPPGRQELATLNMVISQCPVDGNGPGAPCNTLNQSVAVVGNVTGSLPTAPAQIQITPTQPVAIYAAPGSTSVTTYGNDLYIGYMGSVEYVTNGVGYLYAGACTPGSDGSSGCVPGFNGSYVSDPTTTPATVPTPGSFVNGIYGILVSPQGVLFSDSVNNLVQVPNKISPTDIELTDKIGQPYPSSQCLEFNLGSQAANPFFEFYGCTNVPSLAASAALTGTAQILNLPTTYYINFPTAMATDGYNTYVADTNNSEVDVVQPGVSMEVRVGGGGTSPYTNGQGEGCGGFVSGQYGTSQCWIYAGDSGDGGQSFNAVINPPTSLAISNGYLFIASDTTHLPYLTGPQATDNNIRMVTGANIISTPKLNGVPLTGGGLVTDSLGNLYITSKNPIQKVTFDANENPVSISDWAPNLAGFSPTMSNTGAIVLTDGTNINQIGNTGFLTFAAPGLHTTSPSVVATITNSGGANLVITSANAIGGPNASDFAIVSDTCSAQSVPSGSACTITLTYTSSSSGTETALITVATNVGTGSQIINLTGTTTSLMVSTPVVPTSATDGVPLSTPITATASGGVPPYTFTTNLASNSGNWVLQQSGSNISISGTPSVSGAVPFTITVTDSATPTPNQATANAVLQMGTITLTQTGYCPYCPYSPIGFGQMAYNAATTSASGGTAPYHFTLGSYPAGSGTWSISSADNVNAYVSLLPIVTGWQSFTIDVVDANGATGSVSGVLYVGAVGTTVQVTAQQQVHTSYTALSLTGTVSTAAFGGVDPSVALPKGTVDFLVDGVDQNDPQNIVSGTNPTPATLNVDILFHTIDATYSGDGNYSGSAFDYPATVNGNRPQTITFPTGLNVPVGTTIALTANASSGLPVTYFMGGGTGQAMLDATGQNLIVTGAGQIIVGAQQNGDKSFAPATNIYANFFAF